MLREDIDLASFFTAVNQCKGEVVFLSAHGDRMDLKSVLCQYLFASVYLQNDVKAEGCIECEFQEDTATLKSFLKV